MIRCLTQNEVTVPAGVNEDLRRFGGLGLFGDPLYRWVWGGGRREIMGGSHVRRYPVDRFFVEFWRPPSEYGDPVLWGITDTTGLVPPYPKHGDYEAIWCAEGPGGDLVWPTIEIGREVVRRHRLQISRRREERWRKLLEQQEKKSAQTKRDIRDVIDGHSRPFGYRDYVVVDGFKEALA